MLVAADLDRAPPRLDLRRVRRASAPGLLIDTANLDTLGFTSLLLTLAGFWTGRYGETTARDRFHAPFLSVAVITVLYALGTLALNFVLGEPAPAGAYLSAACRRPSS